MTETAEVKPTWARAKAEVEFESIPRTTGPFTGVITEYHRRIAKLDRRYKKNPTVNRVDAIGELVDTVTRLEQMNGIEA